MIPEKSFNILIIRVSSIGDVIHTLPAFFLLKRLYPHASISWLAQKKVAPLLETQPFFKKVWVLQDRYLHIRHIRHTFRIVREIQKHNWDVILDFQGILKTSLLLPFFKGIKIGFSSKNVRQRSTTLFTHHHVHAGSENIIQKNLSLASSFHLREIARKKNHLNTLYHTTSPSLEELKKEFIVHISQQEKEKVRTWLSENALQKFIILSPNTTWESKLWPKEYWIALIKLLIHNLPSFSLILLGNNFGNPAQELVQQNHLFSHKLYTPPPWNLATLSFLISQASLLIAPDTGLLHLADFVGTRTIGIFGPTLIPKHGPFLTHPNKHHAIQIACNHFYQKHHRNEQCMHALTPEMLFERIIRIVSIE